MQMEEAQREISVLCVDDNPTLAGLYKLAIDMEPGMASAGTLHRADGLVEEVQRRGPDIVLLDLSMPGRDPIQALEELSERCPSTRTIVFSAYDDSASVDRAVEAGAWGYVSKDRDPEEVLDVIRQVARGEFVLDLR